MSGFTVIRERLELKYLIDSVTAERIRRDVEPFCDADAFNPREGGGYPLYSLYLDTPSLLFFRAKQERHEVRMKLRIRTYGEKGPAFFEIKRKIRQSIHKTRVGVSRDHIRESCMGYGVPLRDRAIDRKNLNTFALEVALHGARPIAMVRYEREAYISTVDDYARVTFDRRLEAWSHTGWDLDLKGENHVHIDSALHGDGLSSPVILELKCGLLMPIWMQHLIRRHTLQNKGFSKYAYGLALLRMRERGIEDLAWLQGRIM